MRDESHEFLLSELPRAIVHLIRHEIKMHEIEHHSTHPDRSLPHLSDDDLAYELDAADPDITAN